MVLNLRVLVIDRKAGQSDLERAEQLKEKEAIAFKIFKEKVIFHKLDMKLIATHYLLEEQKVLFFFSSENRVDFRELVKDLVSVFKMRIELRQIGVRDESRITGGLGVCGRDIAVMLFPTACVRSLFGWLRIRICRLIP